MSTQNVFIFWISPLFYESIAGLLRHPNIKLVGATSDYATISSEIIKTRPNAILIENTDKDHIEMVSKYLEKIPWAVKIILLGFKDNKLNVYQHEQRSMAQTEDLVQLIIGEL